MRKGSVCDEGYLCRQLFLRRNFGSNFKFQILVKVSKLFPSSNYLVPYGSVGSNFSVSTVDGT